MKLEDLHITKPTDFTVFPNMVQDNKPMIGNGRKRNVDPAKKLKDKIKKMNKMKNFMSNLQKQI